MVKASPFLIGAFAALAVLVAVAYPVLSLRAASRGGDPSARRAALRTVAAVALWLALTGALAAAGRLSFSTRPPTIMLVIVLALVLTARWALSAAGARLAAAVPVALLVAVQGFRLPLELLMHRAYTEGLMPVQMSFSGRNFDIVTGTSALLLAVALARGAASRRLVWLWNWMGLALLLNVVTIALLSAPTPLRVFMNEPANVWITRAPFIWLPAVLVPCALAGHLLVLRWLRATAPGRTPASAPAPAERPLAEARR
jgi:hypothetical protein